MAAPESFRLAAEALRALDPDRYRLSLMVPSARRGALQSLYAFSAEVAAVRERVQSPAPGEIRLQWWSDALEGREHGAVSRNPVADALLTTLGEKDLPAGPLVRLVAARRFDLYDDPMPDIGQFEGYAGETVSILYHYGAMILAGATQVPGAADAAGHLGVAEALVGHVRAFGYNAARGQIFLPLSVFAAHGVGEADILSGRDSDSLRAALAQLTDMAEGHLDKARAALAEVPGTARAAFAATPLVTTDIAALRKEGYAPFAPPVRRNAFTRLARLMGWMLAAGRRA